MFFRWKNELLIFPRPWTFFIRKRRIITHIDIYHVCVYCVKALKKPTTISFEDDVCRPIQRLAIEFSLSEILTYAHNTHNTNKYTCYCDAERMYILMVIIIYIMLHERVTPPTDRRLSRASGLCWRGTASPPSLSARRARAARGL